MTRPLRIEKELSKNPITGDTQEITGVKIWDDPEIIDNYMRAKIASCPAKGGKKGAPVNTTIWKENDLELRNAVVIELVCKKCYSKEACAQELSKRWGCSLSTAREYTKKGLQSLYDNYKEVGQKIVLDSYREKVERIANTALNSGDTKLALQAVDMLNKMGGAYTEKKDLNISGEATINFKFED